MSLFDSFALPATLTIADDAKRPLAERMRPETLEDFVGQEHILGAGKAAAGADRARPACSR